jgi:hypothetical protein
VLLVVVAGVAALVLHAYLRAPPTVWGTPLAYSQTVGPTSTAQASRSGGPWSPIAVLGIGSPDSPSGGGGLASGCTTTWSNSSDLVAPATPGNATAGKAATWLVISSDSGGAKLMTLVSETSATVVASNLVEWTGSCLGAFTAGGKIVTAPLDSSVVGASTNTAGGASFASSHTVVTRAFLLTGDLWTVIYTTCDLYASSGGSGSEFVGVFNATSGVSVGTQGAMAAAC